MGHLFVRVSRGPNWFWLAKCHTLVEREEHHHCPDTRNHRCDARWINTVSLVSIFWYNLNGFLNVENVWTILFFPRQKGSRWRPGGGLPGGCVPPIIWTVSGNRKDLKCVCRLWSVVRRPCQLIPMCSTSYSHWTPISLLVRWKPDIAAPSVSYFRGK